MDSKIKAIKNHDNDNVVTIFGNAGKGDTVEIFDKKGNRTTLVVKNDIPYGHKAAISPIQVKEQVTKYGEEIGIATVEITVGEHVHIHNIDSIRGRGDWAKEGDK